MLARFTAAFASEISELLFWFEEAALLRIGNLKLLLLARSALITHRRAQQAREAQGRGAQGKQQL